MKNLPGIPSANTTPNCGALGFDSARIREAILLVGLNAEHGKLAERIRREVIEGNAAELVSSCSSALARERGFSLIERNVGIEHFEQGWIRCLQCYGQDFDTVEYFEKRLAVAALFARGKIPLRILQLQHCLTQQVLVDRLSVEFVENAAAIPPLVDCVLKLTSLDLYLAAEGYRPPDVDELRAALDKLRAETSRLHQEASIDQLTGVMNYASLMESLEREINAAHRDQSESSLCLMMTDLDFFKQINDTHGHVVGDFVLRHVAGRLQAAVRDFDIVGRFGGEEFVIIMTNANLELAKIVAERIRKGVMETPLHLKELSIQVTISLGVAMLRKGERKEALLERADVAMYEAKKSGRNRVIIAKDADDAAPLPEL